MQKSVLGKGIASLIQSSNSDYGMEASKAAPAAVAKGETLLVPVGKIKPNQYQPRRIFKEKDIVELCESIKENGIIQPLIVIEKGNEFELIAGERRLRAAKLAGLEQVPVVIKKATDREKLVMAIIENVQRSDLNCVEEALAYFQLMEEFKLKQEEVAKKIGKERSTVANFLRILKLPRDVISLLKEEKLSFGHAKVLAVVKEPEQTKRLALQAVEENLSVRELEILVGKKTKIVKDDKKETSFNDKLEPLRNKLEQKTGFHFKLAGKKNGAGLVTIKFNNEAEFNDIYQYLMK
ncbi:MAG: ParB/RepB/Spo0J family partition protein [Bacteriovoracaceae bacterium]